MAVKDGIRAARAALPVGAVLDKVSAALSAQGTAVLIAPPGAGKTTLVPLALMADDARHRRRIVMLEPRRIAARGAAERMASTLGEAIGASVGYRMRGAVKTGPGVRIEVVTEGVLTRMLQADPSLDGVDTLIFDEFHERSLNADLGLAFALEARTALRPDLEILVMSATLDGAAVAGLLGGAAVIESQGRMFPVETVWLHRPENRNAPGYRFEAAMAGLIERAAGETNGGMLAFLPGEAEIRRTAQALAGRITGAEVLPLYGRLPQAQQARALNAAGAGAPRRIVLATSIAETSVTIPDITVVVDGGLARRARHDPSSGMSRLVTERAARSEADQRRGRAGRTGPGHCYRLWTRAEEGAMAAQAPAEIEVADLAAFALDLAAWGARDGDGLALLTPPPAGPLAAARRLLAELGALEPDGGITAHGRAMARVPLHPRLAHMLLTGGADAPRIAALLTERLPTGLADGVDLSTGLKAFGSGGLPRMTEAEARRLARMAPRAAAQLDAGETLALAFPDRIAQRRPGDAPRYLMSGGRGAVLDAGDGLAGQPWLAVAETDGAGREVRIRSALPLTEAGVRAAAGTGIARATAARWDRRSRSVVATVEDRLGAIVLSSRRWDDCPAEARAAALLDGVRDLGPGVLNWSASAASLRDRVAWLRRHGGQALPDMSDEGLLAALDDWLMGLAQSVASFGALCSADPYPALEAWIGWDGVQAVNRLAPARFTAPTGTGVAIDYTGDQPGIAVRLQEMFGVTSHPAVGADRVPLVVTLLSPARRPVQTTTDLPAFWAGSYAEVRKDMRGRYPRHPWPEDPAAAIPTTRAKPRGS